MSRFMAKLTSLKSEKRLLDRRAADQIRAHILEGVLPAGERLLETQLSEELEVSRGTVRSALAQLANEGLVQQVAFTRWEVSGTSTVDAWEIYTLRGALEGLGARLAAANVAEADGARLRGLPTICCTPSAKAASRTRPASISTCTPPSSNWRGTNGSRSSIVSSCSRCASTWCSPASCRRTMKS